MKGVTYIVSKIEVTEARHAIDGKKHTHKYFLYPVPENLKEMGFVANWSYKNGRRGALKFSNKRQAQAIAKRFGATVEEI